MNEYIKNLVYNAHACLSIKDPKDKGVIDEAIDLLDSVDLLVIKPETKDIIVKKKGIVEKEMIKQEQEIKNIPDPIGFRKEELKIKKWKLKEYISFYNTLNVEGHFGD